MMTPEEITPLIEFLETEAAEAMMCRLPVQNQYRACAEALRQFLEIVGKIDYVGTGASFDDGPLAGSIRVLFDPDQPV